MGVLASWLNPLLFFLPWLDTSPVRSGHYRRFPQILLVRPHPCLVVRPIAGQTALYPVGCSQPDAAAYYFAHFLIILPIASRIERPLPRPINYRGCHRKPLQPALRKQESIIMVSLMLFGSCFQLHLLLDLVTSVTAIQEPAEPTAEHEFYEKPLAVSFAHDGPLGKSDRGHYNAG